MIKFEHTEVFGWEAAYDECGLTDKMNAALGYSGQFAAELPKEE